MTIQINLNGVRREVTPAELFQYAQRGVIGPKTQLWLDGKETTCDNVQGIRFGGSNNQSTNVPSSNNASPSVRNGEIVQTPFLSYSIGGGSTPFVICYLDAGRSIYSSNGGRVWMKGAIETQTNAQGGFLKSLGRWASGESLFMSVYNAKGPSEIAFATKMPGHIVAKTLSAGESLICQRGAFLAATQGVSLDVFFQKKLGAGFFGGEGFIMQRITGPGVVFLELDGAPYEYNLKPGEQVTCDTGALAWMDSTCSIDVVTVAGLKNIVFGGEGLFDTVITGPGKVTFQSMSVSQMAGVLAPFLARLISRS